MATNNHKKQWYEHISPTLILWGCFIIIPFLFAIPYALLTPTDKSKVPQVSEQSSPAQSTGCNYEGCREDENEDAQYEYYKTMHEGDDGCNIKGNVSYGSGEKIYHLPSDPDYNSTTVNPAYGERWFCSEQEAQDAGWRHAANQ